jgi:hypothetical protein
MTEPDEGWHGPLRARAPFVVSKMSLNPDEWVWKNVKHDTVGRQASTGLDDFTAKVITALERLARLPQLIRAFFGDPNLRYITA